GDKNSLIGKKVDVEKADLIMAVRLNTSQWDRQLPAIDAIMRKKKNRGAKLIVINAEESGLSKVADVAIKSDEVTALKGIAQAMVDMGAEKPDTMDLTGASVDDDIKKAAELYMKANNPVILSCPSIYEASSNLSLIKGDCISIPFEANAKGVVLMGITGEGGKSYKEMVLNGGVKVLYVIGEIPLDKRPDVDFLIVQNSHMTPLASQADIVLPSTTYLEKEGTIVDYMGRLRHLRETVKPVEESKNHSDIFIELAKKMGIEDIKKPDTSEIEVLASVEVEPKVSPFEKRERLDVTPSEMIDRTSISVVEFSRACL
ncbi:MAG: hypothetical protein D6828_02390, partial [Nitrospirae bacterium]